MRLRDSIAGVVCVCLGSCYFALLRLANITRPRVVDPLGPEIITAARLLPPHVLAITFGKYVFCKRRIPALHTLRHELVHCEQYRFYGWIGFLWRYGVDISRHGYAGSYLESEARQRANG